MEWKGRAGLAEDVRYYGQWMRDEAEKRIGHLYPKANCPTVQRRQSSLGSGRAPYARPIQPPRARWCRSSHPSCSLPKQGKKAWVEPVIDAAAPDGWRFEVKTGSLSEGR